MVRSARRFRGGIQRFFRRIKECTNDESESEQNSKRSNGRIKKDTSKPKNSKETYEDIVAFILAYTKIATVKEAERVTMYEYKLYQQARNIVKLDREEELHFQAFLIRQIKAIKRDGKSYVYKKFSEFFNRKKRYSELVKKYDEPVNERLFEIAKRMQEFRKEHDYE